MSAFEVGDDHINAMLTAGIVWGEESTIDRPMSWVWPRLTRDEAEEASERGASFSSAGIELYQARHHLLTPATAGRVGAMLVAQNRASVNFRYDEDEWETPFLFDRLPGTPEPVTILKAVRCYEYQACETPDWDTSEAEAFCEALIYLAISVLPGFDSAPGWPIPNRHVFLPPERRSA